MEKEAAKWCDMLDKNPGEEWLKRVTALQNLTKMFAEQDDAANDATLWNPALFRILRLPIQRQIKDLRSGITKEVGEMLVQLAVSAQDAAGPFFLDIFPTILEVLNSGNKVIFGHVDVAMQQVFPNTRIKKAVAMLCKEATKSKSVQLREFCSEYLFILLQCWGRAFLQKDADTIGASIEKCFLDASPNVRTSARSAYLEFSELWPERGAELYNRLDQRTQRFLEKHADDAASEQPKPKSATSKVSGSRPGLKTGGSFGDRQASPAVPRRAAESPRSSPKVSEPAPAEDQSLPIGSQVLANVREGNYKGTVRFVGTTSFAKGTWCGVELQAPDGKNDGTVGGQRYFSCPKNYGLFVRPNQLTLLEEEEDVLPPPPPKSSGGSAAKKVEKAASSEGEDWSAMGLDLLHEHKKHIDAVLSQLREEMELLADFERMQDRLTKERVITYNEAMRVCVEHRDELSSEFKSSVQICYDKYGVSHDNLSLE